MTIQYRKARLMLDHYRSNSTLAAHLRAGMLRMAAEVLIGTGC